MVAFKVLKYYTTKQNLTWKDDVTQWCKELWSALDTEALDHCLTYAGVKHNCFIHLQTKTWFN